MAKNKVNPRRRPVSEADVIRAKREATDFAVEQIWSIFFTVLRDKEGFSIDDLKRVWAEIEDLSDSINRGYCSISDLKHTLKTEIGAIPIGRTTP